MPRAGELKVICIVTHTHTQRHTNIYGVSARPSASSVSVSAPPWETITDHNYGADALPHYAVWASLSMGAAF